LPFFALTLFVSSALLFLIQPMFAKMILPRLGGTSSVWNTCMVFFQAVLLAGYGYAHFMPARLGIRKQCLVHFGLLLLPFLVLPIALDDNLMPPEDANPIPWLLGVLFVTVGLPFFVVSTTAPLLQKWFAETGHRAGGDPYFLYVASNFGSMLALFAYPLLVEPSLPLRDHTLLWMLGYGILIVLTSLCAYQTWRSPSTGKSNTAKASSLTDAKSHSSGLDNERVTVSGLVRLRWVILSLVPSSLLLSVTTYLTTDIAAIPLLWVIPLGLYLLTFILVFARKPRVSHSIMLRLSPLAVLLLTIVMLSEATEPVWIVLPMHLAVFFILAMVCHGELVSLRPSVEHLTEFYLWISVGGVLGGIFNAILAPLAFPAVIEYPLMLVIACLIRPPLAEVDKVKAPQPARAKSQEPGAPVARRIAWQRDVGMAASLGLLSAGGIVVWPYLGLESGTLAVGILFGVPAVICYTFLARPIRFGLSIGALLLAGALYQGVYGGTLYRQRSFFGVHRVTRDRAGNYHQLIHGNTFHGRQNMDEARRREPLMYYHRTGPIGQLFDAFSGAAAKPEVAVVGLGAGSLAAYGQPGQQFTFFEIDPVVVRIAQDKNLFTFLHDCRARVKLVLGDARLTLKKAPEHQFDILVMDAFSSDAIPLHLLTREAVQLYKKKVAEDGIVAFNISNRYLDLEAVLAALARDAGLVSLIQHDFSVSATGSDSGKFNSVWVIMARQRADLGRLASDPRWQAPALNAGVPVWTDDFSNIFSVFQWH